MMLKGSDGIYGQLASTLIYAPVYAAGSAFLGYVSAKLSDLPTYQVAKAWAVWGAAEYTLISLGDFLKVSHAKRLMFKATLFTATSIIGLHELRKRQLIGDRLIMVILIIRSLIIFGLITRAIIAHKHE